MQSTSIIALLAVLVAAAGANAKMSSKNNGRMETGLKGSDSALENLGAIYDNLQANDASRPLMGTGVGTGTTLDALTGMPKGIDTFNSKIGGKVTSFQDQAPQQQPLQQQEVGMAAGSDSTAKLEALLNEKPVDANSKMGASGNRNKAATGANSQTASKGGISMVVGSVVTAQGDMAPEQPRIERNVQVDPVIQMQQGGDSGAGNLNFEAPVDPMLESKAARSAEPKFTDAQAQVDPMYEEPAAQRSQSTVMQLGSVNGADNANSLLAGQGKEVVYERVYVQEEGSGASSEQNANGEPIYVAHGMEGTAQQHQQMDEQGFADSEAQVDPGMQESVGNCVENMYACSADGNVILQCNHNHWVVRNSATLRHCSIVDGTVLITG